MPLPKISIIIVSFNTKDITIATLDSIYQYTNSINFEVIVVDNGSQDGSVEALTRYASTKKNFTFKSAGVNLGFGIANNLGASLAKGRYLLFLNSDTLFQNNIIPQCLKYLESKPNTGVYSCRLLNKDGSLQPSGGFFPTLGRVLIWQLFIDDLPIISRHIHSIHPHRQFYQKHPVNLDWVTGAFMIIPYKIFKKLGGFDKHIFMYTEEMEFCFRVSKSGYRIVYHPDLHIIHLGRASSASIGSFFSLTSEVKYTLYFFQKHKPLWQLPLVKICFIIGALLRFIIFGIIKNNATSRRTYLHVLKLIA